METRKLFYEDSHLRKFSASVVSCAETEKGYEIILDATAFYPEGGGEAPDLGILGGVHVLDVQERDGEIIHFCDAPLSVGETVCGEIDWQRRFDLMQQHTGEHIISGLLHAKFGYMNTGFHVGADVMEVDFDGPISPEDLAEIEQKANEAVWADIPLKCWIPTPEELKKVTYRTKRELPWPVRIVQVPSYDSCACCGVHVKHTGEVGMIKILSCVSLRGGIRLEMVCGQRAYRHMVTIFEENRRVSQAFSAPMNATGAAALKMNEALAAEKSRATGLQNRILDTVAESYVNFGDVLHFEPELDGNALRYLADKIASVCGGRVAVFSGGEGSFAYCLAQRDGDLRELNRRLTGQLHGRGGGKPHFQQGSVQATEEEIRSFFA
ncbi:MAG: alanyl-tRNA editing protein [Ruminococcaceae bacterium]|nr:alanyl-tRNA editing protein [Oscillospiraceae bacterium]